MTHPTRIQLSRRKGWRMPPNTVKVDRSACWGNPYRVGEPVDMSIARQWGFHMRQSDYVAPTAEDAVRKFAALLAFDGAAMDMIRRELRGKHLACWCPLDGPCHADVLLQLANGDP